VLEDSHDRKAKMGRPGKKVVNGATLDEPSRGEDQSLNYNLSQEHNLLKQVMLKSKDSKNLKI